MTTNPIGGGALVERWFLRMMLVVSIVAWLALLLAEAGPFRLVPILLIVWGGWAHPAGLHPLRAGGGRRDPAVRHVRPVAAHAV